MANEFYYPWYPAHYRRDAGHLDHIADSCYRRLLDWYMESGEPIKKDVPKLMHIMGCSAPQFQSVWPAIEGFFTLINGFLHHKRCDIELDRQDASVKQKSVAGIHSAKKRRERFEQFQLLANVRTTDAERTFNGPTHKIIKSNGNESNLKEDSINNADAFESWYLQYPRKVGRGQAERAFKTALGKADLQTLIDGAVRYRTDPNRKDEFTKHPGTWLTGQCWLDEPLPEYRNGKANGHNNHPPSGSASGFAGVRAEARSPIDSSDKIDK